MPTISPGARLEVDAVDRRDGAGLGARTRRSGRGRRAPASRHRGRPAAGGGHRRLAFGSRASRRLSPNTLNARASSMIATPGRTASPRRPRRELLGAGEHGAQARGRAAGCRARGRTAPPRRGSRPGWPPWPGRGSPTWRWAGCAGAAPTGRWRRRRPRPRRSRGDFSRSVSERTTRITPGICGDADRHGGVAEAGAADGGQADRQDEEREGQQQVGEPGDRPRRPTRK